MMTATAPAPAPFAVAYRPAGAGGRCWHVVATTGRLAGASLARTTNREEADRLAADLCARSVEIRAIRHAHELEED